MDELMQKLSGYLDAAAGVITEYAPKAVEAALSVIRIDAIFHLAVSVVLLFGTYGAVKLIVHHIKRAIELDNENKDEEAVVHCFGAGIGGFVAFITFIGLSVSGYVFSVLNPYYWVAAIDPTLGLVYKAAQSAGLL